MFKGYHDWLVYLETGELSWFLLLMISVVILVVIRILGAELYRICELMGWLPKYPRVKRDVVSFVIAYNEPLDIFEKCLDSLRRSLEVACNTFHIMVVIDGMRRHPKHSREMAELASHYAHFVYGTETGDKRNSITKLSEEADRLALPGNVVDINDSDTICEDDQVGVELFAPFADLDMGIVTTAQTIYEPKTSAEQDSNLFEKSRLNGSQRFLSLPGVQQIGCAPGRRIAILRRILREGLYAFNNEYLFGRKCIPGDDRFLTLLAQKAGLKSIMVPSAKVKTMAKETYFLTFKMWLRWGRTSQRYTIMNPWLIWKKPFTAFVMWSDIYITIAVTAMVGLFFWALLFGGSWMIPLYMAVLLSITGMALSMASRQYRLLPEIFDEFNFKGILQGLWRLLRFTIVATLGQLIRFWALLTMFNTDWLTRAGADESKKSDDDSIWPLYVNGEKVA